MKVVHVFKRQIIEHLLAGCLKIVGVEYKRSLGSELKVLAVKLATDNDQLPYAKKWYKKNWEKGKVLEVSCIEAEITNCILRRPDV